ncbi:hypothetical protein Bhyg_06271 [Pseudolycoriella hygida]|uniref:Uncharacterized protein n=1 Tax=Pseudolycoriella hygida TaxID=35572 RepID=A0A9Q0S2N9_9DIPT|nr:hypothetical protein Bhyg_06271 [Pseudolycoriella hygida]
MQLAMSIFVNTSCKSLKFVVMLPKVVLLLGLICTIACNDTPGFFLKVSKNIPRIGRRSSDFDSFFLKSSKSVPRIGRRDQFVDDTHSPEGFTQQWYDRIMTSSKRASGVGYNNVQPFDTKFLLDMFASEHIDPEDFKFVSWKDFDIALESDEQLFKKLIELAKTSHEIATMTSHSMNFDKFVPMGANGGNSLYYRTERSDASVNGNKDFNKERMEYQS